MTVLGYSELAREIYGVTPDLLKKELQSLFSTKITDEKISLLQILANKKRATVSELLREAKRNNTGGTFISTTTFFDKLTKLGLLNKNKVGRRTYYFFVENSSLQRWIK